MRDRWIQCTFAVIGVALLASGCCCGRAQMAIAQRDYQFVDDTRKKDPPHAPPTFKRLRIRNGDGTGSPRAILEAEAYVYDTGGSLLGQKTIVGSGGIRTSPLYTANGPVDWFPGIQNVATIRVVITVGTSTPGTTHTMCLEQNAHCGVASTSSPVCGAGGNPIEFAQCTFHGLGNWDGNGTTPDDHRYEGNRQWFTTWGSAGYAAAASCTTNGGPFGGSSQWGTMTCSADLCHK